VPALIFLTDLPELLFAIINDIKTEEDKIRCKRFFPSAIDSLTLKVASLIDHGKLSVFERGTRMRVDEDTPVHDSDIFLVRLDDVERLCHENGIEVSHASPAATDSRELAAREREVRIWLDENSSGHDSDVIHDFPDGVEWSYYEEQLQVSDTLIPRIKSYMRKSAAEKPLGTRERNNFLRIIAALCKKANLDYERQSSTADEILIKAQLLDQTISKRTITTALRDIPKALKRPDDE